MFRTSKILAKLVSAGFIEVSRLRSSEYVSDLEHVRNTAVFFFSAMLFAAKYNSTCSQYSVQSDVTALNGSTFPMAGMVAVTNLKRTLLIARRQL